MSTNQLFIADHRQASNYARSQGAQPAELIDFGDVTDLELEILAELAAKKVHATGVKPELGMVDVDLDQLLVVPDAVTEVFAELLNLEDPEGLDELITEWADSEEFEEPRQTADRLVKQVASFAAKIAAADEDSRLALYFLNA
ncbi:hypothetical protein [Psychromicrobium lacuslunae]|uniref:hypothetical protein n=1 Tax=Psychromicrobium lacuslunae TaxID=1618207 RepID=UPI00069778A0|nr:hypothetical protein [Psychromicrobium lacuslunae]